MAKLNVDEIEANGTNSNVKVTTKGTDGSCEIKAATNDATLQLNCSVQTHGVKLKAPANSDGQNYTMILPDNQIAANKLLKVKSVTGTGVSAVGQLEYADVPSQSLASLNADNITSETLPAARIPTLTASQGAAFELVSKQTVGSNQPSEISFTGLEDNTMYRIVAQHISFNAIDYLYMFWLDSNNSNQSGIVFEEVYYYSASTSYDNRMNSSGSSSNFVRLSGGSSGLRGDTFAVIADFNTKAGNNWMIINAMQPGLRQRYYTSYASYGSSVSSYRIHGIKIKGDGASTTFNEGSEIVLYKYRES